MSVRFIRKIIAEPCGMLGWLLHGAVGPQIAKCNTAFYFAAMSRDFGARHSQFALEVRGLFAGPTIAFARFMNFWANGSSTLDRRRATRHQFVIGPLCERAIFQRKARLYYCIRCKWSFLVCGGRVAVLDEDGNPLGGDESLRKFATFEEGPCPVLEAFVSTASFDGCSGSRTRECDEPVHLVPRHAHIRSERRRPVLHIVSRVRRFRMGRSSI